MANTQAKKYYANLYSCKNFRNRVIRLQALLNELQLDAILLIIGKFEFALFYLFFLGLDSKFDFEMKKLANWLLFGLSG